MSSRTRQPQVDVDSLRTEVTANILATVRGELQEERTAFRETFQEATQNFINNLGNREQGDQARAASVQQAVNDRFDHLQEQLQQERTDQGRRFEFIQANARQLAAPLVIPHHNNMRREA